MLSLVSLLYCAVTANAQPALLLDTLESPEHGAAWFEKIDTNADSFLDIDELHSFVETK